jgi:hypothetical protein
MASSQIAFSKWIAQNNRMKTKVPALNKLTNGKEREPHKELSHMSKQADYKVTVLNIIYEIIKS